MSSTDELLFYQADWHNVTENQINSMSKELVGISGDRLLNTSVADLTDYLVAKYGLDVPVIHKDGTYVEQEETEVDVSRDFRRVIFDPSRPHYITGTAVYFTVPFSGDHNMFRVRPSSFSLNPPRGTINRNTLVLTFAGVDLDQSSLIAGFDKRIKDIETNLSRQRQDAKSFNDQLRQKVAVKFSPVGGESTRGPKPCRVPRLSDQG